MTEPEKLRGFDLMHVGARKNAVEIVRLLAKNDAHDRETLHGVAADYLGGDPAGMEKLVGIDLDLDDQFVRVLEQRVRKESPHFGNCHAETVA